MNRKRVLVGVILLATLVLPAIAAPPDGKSTDPDVAVAEKWIAAWNSHNPDKMLPLFTDDIVYEDVAFGEVSHGSAELRKFAASEFDAIPDLELKLAGLQTPRGWGLFLIENMVDGLEEHTHDERHTVRLVMNVDPTEADEADTDGGMS